MGLLVEIIKTNGQSYVPANLALLPDVPADLTAEDENGKHLDNIYSQRQLHVIRDESGSSISIACNATVSRSRVNPNSIKD